MSLYPKTIKPILIVQSSPMRTCSTVLANVLYGLVYELSNKPIIDYWNKKVCNFSNKVNVIKTHILDLEYFTNTYEQQYDVYFVCSERKQQNILIDKKYISYSNLILFDYQDLLETPTNRVDDIVDTVYKKMITIIPRGEITYSTLTAKKRLNEMNKYYETIQNRSFNYINQFYQLHGSHRIRDGNGNSGNEFFSIPINDG